MQRIYAENYKILMKEILNKLRHIVFMDWKTQHDKDINSRKIDIKV